MYFVFVGLLAWNDKVSFMRMVDCRTGDERNVDLADLAQGDVFYDEGGVYVRSQTIYGYPRILAEAGLLYTFDAIEHAFKANGRIQKLVRCQGVWGHVGI